MDLNDKSTYTSLTNCMATRIWLSYLKTHGYSTETLLKGVEFDEPFLMDDSNWIPSEKCYKLADNISRGFPHDEHLFRKMARWAAETKVSKSQWAIFASVISPYMLYKSLPKRIRRLNRHRKCELVEIKKDTAKIRFKNMTGVKPNESACSWTLGLLEAAPLVLGYPLSTVEEVECECDNEEYCTYVVKWSTDLGFFQRARKIIRWKKDLLKLQAEVLEENHEKLLERYSELMIAKNTIEKHAASLEEKIKARTHELELTQVRLLQSEKRSLEHRITGGFAHEMRNALAGAQLEFQAVLNYREQGYSATEVIEQATTRLFETIQSFHEKYQIPRDEVGKEVVPFIKQISHILSELSRTMKGVNKDLERGLSITNQIREYAKLQELKPGADLVDLMALLSGYSKRYERDFEEKGIIFSVIGPEKIIIRADFNHIDSVFTNLLNNARDALSESTVLNREIKAIVGIQKRVDQGKILIKIIDNGPGIPEEHLPEIFEPFFSTKPGSGTGLGLGIVKRLVQLYGGKIDIESKEKEETTFTVTLPENTNGQTSGTD